MIPVFIAASALSVPDIVRLFRWEPLGPTPHWSKSAERSTSSGVCERPSVIVCANDTTSLTK